MNIVGYDLYENEINPLDLSKFVGETIRDIDCVCEKMHGYVCITFDNGTELFISQDEHL